MCKYCEAYKESSIFWNTHNLYHNRKKDNYLSVNLDTLQYKEKRKANLIIESCLEDKVSRGAIPINYCPMCGRKLEE